MSEEKEAAAEPTNAPPESEDDRRAAAAAVNRKRALDQWESNKKRWQKTGVPPASPAKK
ncbi:MAG TPA: hypothetical protein VIA45_09445 [Thermoanaerobaculia bacterium]|jgi:hypothetical protein